MTGRIYLLNDDDTALQPMEVAQYDSEKLLQELLAKYPDLLAGEQINSDAPRRWLLVTREMSVPAEQDGPGRWSLDHLFIDQDAVPTLIEVKRSSDTRIRREVVGQMFDYAANAIVYWPVEEIRAKFESRCESTQQIAEEVLTTFLGEDQDPEGFWLRVKTNLQAGRIRLVFVADEIAAELRRIVEFLNQQMDPAEVLAVEVKQFVGKGMRTLVPRVLGQTENARQKKSPGGSGQQWNADSFLAALRENNDNSAAKAAQILLDWLTPRVTTVWWGQGAQEGGAVPILLHGKKKYHICRMNTNGWFAFRFDWLCGKPPFSDEELRRQLLAKINAIPGAHFGDDALTKRARLPLSMLADPNVMDELKAVLTWLIEQINDTPIAE